MMIKILLLLSLMIQLSCTHRYTGRAPDFKLEKKDEQIKEAKRFTLGRYDLPLPHYNYINFQGERVTPIDIEHVLASTRPGTLQQWRTHHWGAYLSWIAAIPMAIFLRETITDFNFTNLFLLGTSAGTFGYGTYLEQQHKNRIINAYNRELKIKLNLFQKDF